MAFDFPFPATTGQSVSGPNGATWQYDGVKWRASAPWANAAAIISDVAPVSQPTGTIWFDSVGLQSYINYTDPNSTEWVPLVNQSSLGIVPMAVVPDAAAPYTGPTLTGYLQPPGDNRSAYAAFAAQRSTRPLGVNKHNWDGGFIAVNGPTYSDDGVTTSVYAGAVSISTGSNVTDTRHGWVFGADGNTLMPGNLAINGLSIPSGVAGNLLTTQIAFPNTGGNISQNCYGADVWRYFGTNPACLFALNVDGTFTWYTAPSGTAGAGVPLSTAMRLDNSGNLNAYGGYIRAFGGSGIVSAVSTASGTGICLMGWSDGTEYLARTDANGNYNGTVLQSFDGSGNATFYQSVTVNGSLTVAAYLTNTGARIISQGYNNNPSVTVYNTIWGAACMFLDASGNLSFGAADGQGNAQNYCYFNANNAGGLTCGYLVCSNGWGVKYTSGAYNSSNNFLFGWNNVVGGLATVSIDNGGAVYAMANGSDARIKTNIAPSTYDCLSTVLKLPLDEYDLLDIPDTWELKQAKHPRKGEAKRRVGMVAQKVHDIFPEGVRKGDDFDDHLGVVWGFEHNNLVALLVGAVQQLSAEVAELKARHGG